ncbi:MAG: lipoyl(octanoyl) transferase, partial [Deltaproteobacteria bacterium]
MSQHDRQRGAGCRKPLGWIDLGRTDVERVNACQRRWREGVLRGDLPEVLLLTEHDPCYTFGHRAQREDLRLPLDQLRARGFKVVETERGGRITYHGPGQLVCYPILDLFARNLDVAGYVSRLEGVMIGLARRFGVEATRRPGFPGVWCGREKLGAVGIH